MHDMKLDEETYYNLAILKRPIYLKRMFIEKPLKTPENGFTLIFL